MNTLFYIFYLIFASTVFLLLLFPSLIIALFKEKYHTSIPSRFLLYRNSTLPDNGIWFHVCSFGEAKAIASIVDALPSQMLRMTTTTQTGLEAISAYTANSRYLPMEPILPFWIRPQKVLVVMEAELWYMLFSVTRARGAKTMLINARISDRSYHKYMRFRWLYRQIFKYVDEVYAQTLKDKQRLESLGARNVQVAGSLKAANIFAPTKNYNKPRELLICAASTHKNEEILVLKAYEDLRQYTPNAKLIMAPRHPDRFQEVDKLISAFASKNDWSSSRLSSSQNFQTDVTLIDTLGDLVNCYAISDVVILGGAFEPIGGHNALEPAQFGCKIISGEHYFNQQEIFDVVNGIAIIPKEQLSETLLAHEKLPKTIVAKTADMTPILQSIKDTL